MVPCNMQHETVQHATCNMQHGTMQHHHIIAGKHLKQAKCSSRQNVQAGKMSKQAHFSLQHATWYHATSSHHSRQTSQAGKMLKHAKTRKAKVQAGTF